MGAARLLLAAVRKFDRDQGFFLASAIAFGVLLSVIPACLLVLSVLGTWFSIDAAVAEQIGKYLRDLTPAVGPDISQGLLGVVRDSRIAGVAGLAGLAWAATMVFGSLRASLDAVYGIASVRSTFKGLLLDLLMLLLSGAMLLASVLLTSWVEILRRAEIGHGQKIGALAAFLLKYPAPLVFTTLMCLMVYLIAPDRKMPLRPSVIGAVVASLLFETAKQLFGWYVLHLGRYSVIYGSLSTAAIFVLWVYYSAAIFLFGAEIACVIETGPERRAPSRGE